MYFILLFPLAVFIQPMHDDEKNSIRFPFVFKLKIAFQFYFCFGHFVIVVVDI